ncbi:phage integrase family site-specific recombinase [Prevotella sp. CAG:1124]|mgnify:CR=1 FL=1|nr:phage integrase family site-specific recombinase [Prevotella sp. CAG:1124]
MLKNVSLNFSLREPHKKGMTPIYAVVRVGKKQYKVPTGCRIKPWQWDEKKQLPYNNISKDDEANVIKIINTISQIRLSFRKSFLYLCDVTAITTITIIKRKLGMAHKIAAQKASAGAKATTIMERAFVIYYTENPDVKDTTRKVMRDRLNSYLTFLAETGDTVKRLTQRGINEFRDYLVSQRESGSRRISNAQINNLCNVVVRLIRVIATHSEFANYNVSKVDYYALKEVKAKNEWKKKRPLKEEELKALLSCQLTPQEQEFRDLFLMECDCGCRVSDLPKLFDPTVQKHYADKGREVMAIDTQKEHIRAYIWLTDTIKECLAKYGGKGFIYARPDNTRTFTNKYNRVIRSIARKAGLTGKETYKDANGNIKTECLCDIISSHFARYTFIYNMRKRGYTADELRRLTGHADSTMINEVYSVPTDEDEADAVFRAHERISGATSDNICEPQQSTALATYVLHCRDILAWLGEPRESYAHISHPQELARLITSKYEVPLAGMGWNVETIEHLYKSNDMEGYKRLKADIMKLRPNSLNL